MVDQRPGGVLAEDDEESEAFLCSVAAECLNDALLVLEFVEIDIKSSLRQLLSALVEHAIVEPDDLKATQSLKPRMAEGSGRKLSPAAREIVENYIACAMTNDPVSPRTFVAAKRAFRVVDASQARQRVILHMMEALSLLHEEDLEIATPLQVAIDRVRQKGLAAGADQPSSSLRKPN